VPAAALQECTDEFGKVAEKSQEMEQKFVQCVMFLNGVLEGRKGVKK
jgi:hypothetical protein